MKAMHEPTHHGIASLRHGAMADAAAATSWLTSARSLLCRWTGKCWYIHEMIKYEFQVEFELPVSYPVTPFEIVLPELEGKTVKMYRGAKVNGVGATRKLSQRQVQGLSIDFVGTDLSFVLCCFVRCLVSPPARRQICLSSHFKPLWAKNVPAFGIAHGLAMGLGPWLAAEVPHLLDTGMLKNHVNKK